MVRASDLLDRRAAYALAGAVVNAPSPGQTTYGPSRRLGREPGVAGLAPMQIVHAVTLVAAALVASMHVVHPEVDAMQGMHRSDCGCGLDRHSMQILHRRSVIGDRESAMSPDSRSSCEPSPRRATPSRRAGGLASRLNGSLTRARVRHPATPAAKARHASIGQEPGSSVAPSANANDPASVSSAQRNGAGEA